MWSLDSIFYWLFSICSVAKKKLKDFVDKICNTAHSITSAENNFWWYSTDSKMSDSELNETFDLDDQRAEIVPALQKSNRGNLFCIN